MEKKTTISKNKNRHFLISAYMYIMLFYKFIQSVAFLFQSLGVYPLSLIADITFTLGKSMAIILSLLCFGQVISLYGLLNWKKWGAYLLFVTSGVYTGLYLLASGSFGNSVWFNIIMTLIFWILIVATFWKKLD